MASIMLVAFASRMLIPPGFMPASDRPFSIEICWEGLPADLLTRMAPLQAESADSAAADSVHHGPHLHHGNSSQGEHCVFGTACSAGPVPHLPLPGDFSSAQQVSAVAFASNAIDVHLVYLPQSRAPPVG